MTMIRLAELCDLVSDQCLPQESGESVYVGLEHVDGSVFRLRRHGSPSQVHSAKSRFRAGDILYGKLRPYLDKVVLADKDGICSTDILVLRPKSNSVGRYLVGLLHTSAFLDHATSTTQGVNHPRTSWSSLSEFSWNVPPRLEQEGIAAILWKVQRSVEVEEQLIATTRELKQAAMRQLFTRGLRGDPPKETEFGAIPESWRVQPLGECCVVQSGVTKGRKIPPDEAIEVPYLRVANVQDGRLDLHEIKTITIRKDELLDRLLQDGDVVLTEGGDFDKLGRGFIWRSEISSCVHQNHIFAVRANRDLLLPDFLSYLVQSPYGRSYFLTVAHKTTNLACINSTKLKALPVPLPDRVEQRGIVGILQAIDRKTAIHERRCSALRELFGTLLRELMTRRLAVHALGVSVVGVPAL